EAGSPLISTGGIRVATANVVRGSAVPAVTSSPFVPGAQRPEPFTLVIFGATGDLAARKLLPALFGLWQGGYLPEDHAIVGVARRDLGEGFRADVRKALTTFRKDAAGEALDGIPARGVFHPPALPAAAAPPPP